MRDSLLSAGSKHQFAFSGYVYANLGVALSRIGKVKEAMDARQKALEINPDQIYVANNLAWSLAVTTDAALRDGAKAVALAQQANQLSGGNNPQDSHAGRGLCGGRKLYPGIQHGAARIGTGG